MECSMNLKSGEIHIGSDETKLIGKYGRNGDRGTFYPDGMPESPISADSATLVDGPDSFPISHLRVCAANPDEHYHFEFGADAPKPAPQIIGWSSGAPPKKCQTS
jgi:hypothetical protein